MPQAVCRKITKKEKRKKKKKRKKKRKRRKTRQAKNGERPKFINKKFTKKLERGQR